MLAVATSASAATVDCTKPQGAIEKMICGDAELSELDEYLTRYVEAGKLAVGSGAQCLTADQTEWVAVRNRCRDKACLKNAYLNRLGELDALQPGATAIKQITLPRTRTLVWIIPPALDQVAAPRNPKAQPFEATGTLVDDIADRGYVLRTAKGVDYPLVLLMFLEGATGDRLSMLTKERGAVFLARGHAARDEKNAIYFEPSRCVLIYRTAATETRPSGTVDDPERQLDEVRRRTVAHGKVCPDPERPCGQFKSNELSFVITKPFNFDRGRDKSLPFYAVILKSAALCSISEDERGRVQRLFPGQKVFVHQLFCQDFGDKVTYSNINEKVGFLAVYAGETEAEARTVLAKAKASGFPDANIRRTEVIVVYQLE